MNKMDLEPAELSLKDLLKERLISPFASAFIISWSILNYHIVLTLFGDQTTQEKILFIYAHKTGISDNLLLYPLLYAALYVLFFPLIGLATYAIKRGYEVVNKIIKLKFDDISPITKSEYINGYTAISNQNTIYEKEIEEVRAVNSKLNGQVLALHDEKNKIKAEYDNIKHHYDNNYIEITSNAEESSKKKIADLRFHFIVTTLAGVINFHISRLKLPYSLHDFNKEKNTLQIKSQNEKDGKFYVIGIDISDEIKNYTEDSLDWIKESMASLEKKVTDAIDLKF